MENLQMGDHMDFFQLQMGEYMEMEYRKFKGGSTQISVARRC